MADLNSVICHSNLLRLQWIHLRRSFALFQTQLSLYGIVLVNITNVKLALLCHFMRIRCWNAVKIETEKINLIMS